MKPQSSTSRKSLVRTFQTCSLTSRLTCQMTTSPRLRGELSGAPGGRNYSCLSCALPVISQLDLRITETKNPKMIFPPALEETLCRRCAWT